MNDLHNQLLDAVGANDLGLIESLIAHGANVNAHDDSGESVLHLASEIGNTAVIRALHNGGARVDSRNKYKETPLHVGVRHGHLEAVKTLIALGSNLRETDAAGRTPLHAAAIAELIGTNPICEELLDLGAELEARDNDGKTPFSLAVEFGCNAAAERLLSRGADLETMDGADLTPLESAIDNNNRELCLKLVERGALLGSVNASAHVVESTSIVDEAVEDDEAYEPISRVWPEQQSIALVLIAYGADPSFGPVDLRNLTPLRAAVMDGLLPRIAHLLDSAPEKDRPANPHDDIESLLALAVEHQRHEVIGLLDARLARRAIDTLHKATPRSPQA